MQLTHKEGRGKPGMYSYRMLIGVSFRETPIARISSNITIGVTVNVNVNVQK